MSTAMHAVNVLLGAVPAKTKTSPEQEVDASIKNLEGNPNETVATPMSRRADRKYVDPNVTQVVLLYNSLHSAGFFGDDKRNVKLPNNTADYDRKKPNMSNPAYESAVKEMQARAVVNPTGQFDSATLAALSLSWKQYTAIKEKAQAIAVIVPTIRETPSAETASVAIAPVAVSPTDAKRTVTAPSEAPVAAVVNTSAIQQAIRDSDAAALRSLLVNDAAAREAVRQIEEGKKTARTSKDYDNLGLAYTVVSDYYKQNRQPKTAKRYSDLSVKMMRERDKAMDREEKEAKLYAQAVAQGATVDAQIAAARNAGLDTNDARVKADEAEKVIKTNATQALKLYGETTNLLRDLYIADARTKYGEADEKLRGTDKNMLDAVSLKKHEALIGESTKLERRLVIQKQIYSDTVALHAAVLAFKQRVEDLHSNAVPQAVTLAPGEGFVTEATVDIGPTPKQKFDADATALEERIRTMRGYGYPEIGVLLLAQNQLVGARVKSKTDVDGASKIIVSINANLDKEVTRQKSEADRLQKLVTGELGTLDQNGSSFGPVSMIKAQGDSAYKLEKYPEAIRKYQEAYDQAVGTVPLVPLVAPVPKAAPGVPVAATAEAETMIEIPLTMHEKALDPIGRTVTYEVYVVSPTAEVPLSQYGSEVAVDAFYYMELRKERDGNIYIINPDRNEIAKGKLFVGMIDRASNSVYAIEYSGSRPRPQVMKDSNLKPVKIADLVPGAFQLSEASQSNRGVQAALCSHSVPHEVERPDKTRVIEPPTFEYHPATMMVVPFVIYKKGETDEKLE